MKVFKNRPLASPVNPSNLSYLWNFRSLFGGAIIYAFITRVNNFISHPAFRLLMLSIVMITLIRMNFASGFVILNVKFLMIFISPILFIMSAYIKWHLYNEGDNFITSRLKVNIFFIILLSLFSTFCGNNLFIVMNILPIHLFVEMEFIWVYSYGYIIIIFNVFRSWFSFITKGINTGIFLSLYKYIFAGYINSNFTGNYKPLRLMNNPNHIAGGTAMAIAAGNINFDGPFSNRGTILYITETAVHSHKRSRPDLFESGNTGYVPEHSNAVFKQAYYSPDRPRAVDTYYSSPHRGTSKVDIISRYAYPYTIDYPAIPPITPSSIHPYNNIIPDLTHDVHDLPLVYADTYAFKIAFHRPLEYCEDIVESHIRNTKRLQAYMNDAGFSIACEHVDIEIIPRRANFNKDLVNDKMTEILSQQRNLRSLEHVHTVLWGLMFKQSLARLENGEGIIDNTIGFRTDRCLSKASRALEIAGDTWTKHSVREKVNSDTPIGRIMDKYKFIES